MKTPRGFHPIEAKAIKDNLFTMVGDQWMLVTAGGGASWNTMTASWGGFGVLWNREVAFVFVRPTRHTFMFMEKNEHFSISVFPEQYREALRLIGSNSGRDADKMALTGLHPMPLGSDVIGFEESRIAMVCRKIYYHEMDPMRFLDPTINDHYNADFHRMYIGEIQRVFVRGSVPASE